MRTLNNFEVFAKELGKFQNKNKEVGEYEFAIRFEYLLKDTINDTKRYNKIPSHRELILKKAKEYANRSLHFNQKTDPTELIVSIVDFVLNYKKNKEEHNQP